MKKILVVYGSIGLGHKVIAENIASALKKHKSLEVEVLDLFALYPGKFLDISSAIYKWSIRSIPAIWSFLYTNKFFQGISLPLRVPFAKLKSAKYAEYVGRFKPDLILATHPNATGLTLAIKEQEIYHGPIVVAFSDFHFQPYWVYPGADHYLVVTKEQTYEVMSRGYHADQISVIGLPVDSEFRKRTPKLKAKRELGFAARTPLILVSGGSRGWGIKVEDVKALLSTSYEVQIAALVGKNLELEQELRRLAVLYPSLRVFGDLEVSEAALLFAAAHIHVMKPGGLTIAQSLVLGLPMVFVNPLPPMENMNEEYLVSRGAGVAARTSQELLLWVERLLADKKLYSKISESAKKLARPKAAEFAAEKIIDTLNSRY